MPDTTVTLMWIGNRAMLDPTPLTNITQTQANAIAGWDADGKSEIKAVQLTGNYYPAGSYPDSGNITGSHFRTTYQGQTSYPASTFSYTDPADDSAETGVRIVTFMEATFDITVHDANGNATVETQVGRLFQMSNGDIFFRPATTTLEAWDTIDRISRVEVVSATPISDYPATIGFNPSIFEVDVVCFTRGTMIECPEGARRIESLRPGDLVVTRDHGAQPVRWIGFNHLGAETLRQSPHLRPVRIRAGALGANVPSADLLVSPQHRILVRSQIAQKMFGTTEVLVAAKQLCQIDGIDIADDVAEVEYVHFLCDQHEVVMSNGAETETLFTGSEALKSIGAAARKEIFELFPELREASEISESARVLASGRMGRKLAVRHVQNRKELVN